MINIRILTGRTIAFRKSTELSKSLNSRRYLNTHVENQTGSKSLLSLYPKCHWERASRLKNHSWRQGNKATCGIDRQCMLVRGIQTQHENNQEKFGKSRKNWLILGAFTATGIALYAGKSYTACEEQSEEPVAADVRKTEKLNQSIVRNGNKITLEEAIEKSRDIIQRIKDETGGPGFVVAVSVDGQEVWSEGFGYADVENRTPCTPETVLRIASISKSIAMVTVARLWESGQLDIDKPIQHYVPTFPEKSVNGEKVTVTTRLLMSHLSGVRNYNKNYMKQNKNEQNKEVTSTELPEFHIKKHYWTVEESLSLFKDDPLVHKPGSKYLYTTHGFTLLSAVVEAVMKKPFDKVFKELIRDLGLSKTYLDENDPIIYNRGRHYVKDERGRLVNAPYVDLSYKWAGGGLISTVGDIVKFGNIMLYSYQNRKYSTAVNDGRNKNEGKNISVNKSSKNLDNNMTVDTEMSALPGILKSETVRMLWTAVEKTESGDKEVNYGMGWELVTEKEEYGSCRKRRFFPYHTGGALGASSVLVILPPESEELTKGKQLPVGVCVAIITNMVSVGLTKTAFDIGTLFEKTKN